MTKQTEVRLLDPVDLDEIRQRDAEFVDPLPERLNYGTGGVCLHDRRALLSHISAHDAAMGELQRERDEARRERDEAKEMQRMAIEQLRRAEPATLAWLKALDERPLPKSDYGTLFTYHGIACVMMPEDDLRKLEAERDALSAELEKARANERRYLWLRPHLYAQQGDVHIARNGITLPFGVSYYHLSGKELDEAIDIGAAVDLPTTHPGNGREGG